MEFDTVWSGSDKTTYLCIQPDRVPDMSYVSRAEIVCVPVRVDERASYKDWSAERDRALQLLATKQRWRIRDLRCLLGLTPPVMSGIMQRLRRAGLVRSVGHGYVTLIRREAA